MSYVKRFNRIRGKAMKIGIITFHNVVNYGGVLQCYALQQKLKEWGYEAEVIDYENKQFKKFYSPFYITRPYLRKILYMLYAFREKAVRRKKFNNFVKENIILSRECFDKDTISSSNELYDVFITGSDQVWNLELTEMDRNYFLDFVDKKKKISYAASIGLSKLDEEMKPIYKELLSDFNSISVRENSASVIIDDLLGEEVDVHIDPVLLLDKESWAKVCDNDVVKNNEEYIVVYKINKSKAYTAAEYLAKKKGLKVKVIQPDKTCKAGFQKYKVASPADFVTLFKNAKYVITDSFHGTVFSIIFQKKFAYYMDESANNRNSRIQNLLNKLNLQSRNFKDIEQIEFIDDTIDYDSVEIILNKERNKSKQYLEQVIN